MDDDHRFDWSHRPDPIKVEPRCTYLVRILARMRAFLWRQAPPLVLLERDRALGPVGFEDIAT